MWGGIFGGRPGTLPLWDMPRLCVRTLILWSPRRDDDVVVVVVVLGLGLDIRGILVEG